MCMEQDFITDTDCTNICAIDSLSEHHAGRITRMIQRCNLDWTVQRHVDYDGRLVLLIDIDDENTLILNKDHGMVQVSRLEGEMLYANVNRYPAVLDAAAAIVEVYAGQTIMDRWGAAALQAHRRGEPG
jgi:hypothetical protein